MATPGPMMVLDTREFEARLNLLDPLVVKEARNIMATNGEDLLRESSNLAAVDEGTMIGSGSRNTTVRGQMIETTVGFNTPYATRVHYEMVPAPGAKMQPGPKTRAKPGTEFGAAGGLYLQRPLLGKMRRYSERIAEYIKRTVMRGA